MGDMCLYPIMAGENKFELVLVNLKEYGYSKTKYGAFSTEEAAWKEADELNADMGVLRKEAMDIVGANMELPHVEEDA